MGPRRPPTHHTVDRSERYERQAEKKLESPYVRPQPKPEIQREFRKITLTEGLTVKDLAEKLGLLGKDVQKRLMDRGVFATINQTLDKEMAKGIAKDFNAEAEFVTFEEKVMLDAVEVSVSENAIPSGAGGHDHGPRRSWKYMLLDDLENARDRAGSWRNHAAYRCISGYGAEPEKLPSSIRPATEAFTLTRYA